jgi:predicted nuclease of predicted toxin-antitoxin system
VKYLLDEDVNPGMAEIARGLGLDVISVHEIGRRTLSDTDQLDFAGRAGRVFVMRDRDDFIEATLAFFRSRQPHAGVLIIPHTLPNHDPNRMAHTLARWHAPRTEQTELAPYTIDFL